MEPGAVNTKLEDIKQRIGHCFVRSETKIISASYLETLLKTVMRKNCWQLSEAAGESNPYGMQRLLCHAKWDADTVRDDLRDYVMEYMGEPDGVGVRFHQGRRKVSRGQASVQRDSR